MPYQDSEPCLLRFKREKEFCYEFFVSARLGPVDVDGTILKNHSLKVVGTWTAGSQVAEWVLRGAPLKVIASKSPAGLVGYRLKIWSQGRLTRRWIGRTSVVCIPSPPQIAEAGRLVLALEARRGPVVEEAAARGVVVLDLGFDAVKTKGVATRALAEPLEPSMQKLGKPELELHRNMVRAKRAESEIASNFYSVVLGQQLLRAAGGRQWGFAMALLKEICLAPAPQRIQALAEADGTRRTALRFFVDGQLLEQAPTLQALELGELSILMGTRRPYWWVLQIQSVCCRTRSTIAAVRVGVPRSRSLTAPWTSSGPAPGRDECIWSEPQELHGEFTDLCTLETADLAEPLQIAMLNLPGHGTLALSYAAPGQAVPFGTKTFQNPLGLPLLTAHGRIADRPAAGLFDVATCLRFAAEIGDGKSAKSARAAAALAFGCGADSRSLADDGFSPFTAAMLGEDPCCLLEGLDSALRLRILRHDWRAWAELGRGSFGLGHVDISAAPLVQGQLVTEEVLVHLLRHCFTENLPLLAARSLERIDGQDFLMTALERAANPHWLRVAERILEQCQSSNEPLWLQSTLPYAISQVRNGRQQFKLLLDMMLSLLHGACTQDKLYASPSILAPSDGAECPICFDFLWKGKTLAFADGAGRAICPHFLCEKCAQSYASTAASSGEMRCPECRRQADKMEPFLDILKEPLDWFDALTALYAVAMPKTMLLRAISAILPVSADDLAEAIDQGKIKTTQLQSQVSATDFLVSGLYAWTWHHCEEHRLCTLAGAAPDISNHEEWFRHWNFSKNGFLSRGEALRGILRSFGTSSLNTEQTSELRLVLDRTWNRCAEEQQRRHGRCSPNNISCESFCVTGGLGEQLAEVFGLDMGGQEWNKGLRAEAATLSPARLQPHGYSLRPGRRRRPVSARRHTDGTAHRETELQAPMNLSGTTSAPGGGMPELLLLTEPRATPEDEDLEEMLPAQERTVRVSIGPEHRRVTAPIAWSELSEPEPEQLLSWFSSIRSAIAAVAGYTSSDQSNVNGDVGGEIVSL